MRSLAEVVLLLIVLAGCRSEPREIAARGSGGAPGSRGAASPSSIVLRRVWSGEDVNFYAMSVSPDGRFVSFVDWTTGDLALRDLITGDTLRITNKGSWEDSGDYAEASVISPDGRRVAYAWSDATQNGYQLRVIDLTGRNARVLFSNGANIRYITPEAWSPDGREILATVFRADRTNQIALISTAGSLRVLKSLDWRYPSELAFSPDGRYIAFDIFTGDDHETRDIYVLAADGSSEIRVVAGPTNDRLLGWAPDGRILYYSGQAGTPGIWALPMAEGRPAGEPLLLRGDVWRLTGIGLARGTYYYGITVAQEQVHTATVDPTAGRLLSPPAPAESPASDWTRWADWSPDGTRLAYLTRQPGARGPRLVVRTVEGDERREIPLELTGIQMIQWSPEGGSVLVRGLGKRGRLGLFRVDLQSGAARPITYVPGLNAAEPSRDGGTIYIRAYRDGFGGAIVAHDVATGGESEIVSLPSGGSMAISPDGQHLAYGVLERPAGIYKLMIISVGGGEAREVYRTPAPNSLAERGGLAWTPDGQNLLFLQSSESEPTPALWTVPASGGEARKLFAFQGMAGIRLHPDGRRLAFHGGRARGEVWVLETRPMPRVAAGVGPLPSMLSGGGT